jgi:hypothetical protein
MEKSYHIVCPFCKNKQTAFIQQTDLTKENFIQCIVKSCGELITENVLGQTIAETQFLTPGYNNKF